MELLIIILCIVVPLVFLLLCLACYAIYNFFTSNEPLPRASHSDAKGVLSVPTSIASSERNRDREPSSSQYSKPESSSSNPSKQDSTLGSSFSIPMEERTLQVQKQFKALDRRGDRASSFSQDSTLGPSSNIPMDERTLQVQKQFKALDRRGDRGCSFSQDSTLGPSSNIPMDERRLQVQKQFEALDTRRSGLAKMNLPPTPHALSSEEKDRVYRRLKEQIASKAFPEPLLPPKPCRPPKSPSSLPKDPYIIPTIPKKEEEKVEDYYAVTRNCKSMPINEIFEMIKRIDCNRIQGLAGKIYAILHMGKYRKFKNYDQQLRSFNELVQECHNWRRLQDIKIGTAYEGISVCRVIVEIRFLISQKKEKELGDRFAAFEAILIFVNSGEEITVVVSKILELIEQAENQLRKKDSEKAVMEGAARTSKGKNIQEQKVDREKLQRVGDQSFLDRIMFLLLLEIFKLELFWVYKRLPFPESITLTILENEIVGIDSSVSAIALQVEDSVKQGKFGELFEGWKENEYYEAMESKIAELWHDLEQ